MKIILGSSSKWRARVLKEAGMEFEMMAPEIDEKAIRNSDPEKLVLAIANAKADALVPKIDEPALLITSDGVVVCEGQVREKPQTAEEARQFLESYIKSPLELVNAVVVTNTATGKRVSAIDHVFAYFKPSLREAIEPLIQNGDIFTCSGAMRVEDPLVAPHLDHMVGSMDSFQGMPLGVIQKLLADAEQY